MPHHINGRGSYRLDRTFPGIGRLARATGTHKARTFDSINAMVSTLYETGRLDVLRRMRDGELHPMVAYSEWRETGTVQRYSAEPKLTEVVAWVEQAKIGSHARYSYRAQVRRIARQYPHATISQLPGIMRAMRLALTPASFRVLRTAVLAYLRDTLGRRSTVYGDVVDVEPRGERAKPGNPFTVAEVVALPPAVFGEAATMFTTGMGVAEYWGRWTVVDGAVQIHGTKRAGRERVVPLVWEPVLPRVQARWWRPQLKAAASDHVLYDLRRGYAHLLEAAGVPLSRIKAYMGHGARVVTDVYLRHSVLPYLAEDAARIRPLLAPLQRRGLTMLAGASA